CHLALYFVFTVYVGLSWISSFAGFHRSSKKMKVREVGGAKASTGEGTKEAQQILYILDVLKECLPFLSQKSKTSILNYFKYRLDLHQPLVTRCITDGLNFLSLSIARRVYFNTPNGPLERVLLELHMCSQVNLIWILEKVDGKQAYAIHWEPPPEQEYKWKNRSPKVPKSLRIYEGHDKVLPYIKEAGYNAIQLIVIVEHKDYFTVVTCSNIDSMVHVTNDFAVSSRYGTLEDFKRLADEAHGIGLVGLPIWSN
ncbi:hypothetical protein V8G54_011349, partial [Vigna mungo]